MITHYFITPPTEEIRKSLCEFFLENGFTFWKAQGYTLKSLDHIPLNAKSNPSKWIVIDIVEKVIKIASWKDWCNKDIREDVPNDANLDFYIDLVKEAHGPGFVVKLKGEFIR